MKQNSPRLTIDQINFNALVNHLSEYGYKIILTEYPNYTHAEIVSTKLKGYFCSKHETGTIKSSSPHINNKIAVDNKRCFDKLRKCPMILPIPTNDIELEFIVEQLKYWASEEGYMASNEYDYDKYVMEYPKQI